MKHILLLLCVLFGITLCSATICSDESDDDQIEESQDVDDQEDQEPAELEKPTQPAMQPAIPASAPTISSLPVELPTTTPDQTQTSTQQQAPATTATPATPPSTDAEQKPASVDTPTAEAPAQPAVQTQATESTTLAEPEQEEPEESAQEPTDEPGQESPEEPVTEPSKAQPAQSIPSTSTPVVAAPAQPSPTVPAPAEPPAQSTQVPMPVIPEIQPTPIVTPAPAEQPQTLVVETAPEQLQVQTVTPEEPESVQELTTQISDEPVIKSPIIPVLSLDKINAKTIAESLPTLPTPPQQSDVTLEQTESQQNLLDTTLSGPLTGKSIKQAMTRLAPLIMSRSVEKAVEQFTNLPAESALEILDALIKTSRTNFAKQNKGRPFEVKRNDLLQIIFGVASQYRDEAVYNRFFDFIANYPGLEFGIRPLLFVVSISSYPVLIPDLIAWLEKRGYVNPLQETARYALDRTSGRSINALGTYAPSAVQPLLGSLLLYAISNKKPVKIIKTLIDVGADVNYPDASGYTPLIKAVEMANFPVTKLLVEHGGDIDLMVKDEIGSAWQKSSELTKDTIMEYLQKNSPAKKRVAE